MRTDIKYLGYGLIIGVFVTAIIIVGLIFGAAGATAAPVIPLPVMFLSPTPIPPTSTPITPSPTITNTPTPTPVPTSTPTNTFTPSPTATFTVIEQMIADGKILITGPLTREQQMRLYETSIRFIAPTTRESRQIGETINGDGYGHPSNICGPLAVAILQEAGLIQEVVIPHDFWLLNPKIPADRAKLNRAFPSDRFEHSVNKNPLNKIDWKADPLMPGDFMYIEEGTGGNFDHMLVINRVDANGRVYSVTNYNTPDGFIINETLLYDPNDPNAGIFHTWTERQNALSGSTGFGGYELWRYRTP